MTAPLTRTVPAKDIVVLAASAGGLGPLNLILADLPAEFPAALAVVLHRSPHLPSLLPRILARHTSLHVKEATDGEVLQTGTVYVAPPDFHLSINPDRTLALSDGQRICHVRSSANPLFDSAAEVFGAHAIGVVLSGGDGDGTEGAQAIKGKGGVVIAQDKATSLIFSMPAKAIASGAVDHVLAAPDIGPALVQILAAHHLIP